jgi:glycosyltransferase involved in cell wall biosynthesis
MHLHWIANCVVPPPQSLSGGDRIMVECLRRWKLEHRITVYGWEGTRQLLEHQRVEGIEFVLWPASRYQNMGRTVLFAAQSWVGCRHAQALEIPSDEPGFLVSSSDFLPDSRPAFILKQRQPRFFWVASFYLFAPSFIDWVTGQPGPGLAFTAYRPVQRWMLRRILRFADLILTTGEEDRERMVAMGRRTESVFAVRGGVDFSIPASVPEPSEKKYDAVFIGRFHPQKGVRELMRIWRRVADFRPGSRLAMIGSGSLERELKDRARDLKLEKEVDFLGFMDGAEKYRVIKSSRVVVHPAIYDSGGMAPAEALACGLPGVAFDLTSLKTYYPKGFLKAKPGDLDQFADLLVQLLAQSQLYDRLSVEAKAVAQEWNWDVRARQLMEAIQTAMSRS